MPESRSRGVRRVPARKAAPLTLDDAARILRGEEKETIVRLLLEWAKDDDRLEDRLLLYAARQSGPGAGTAAVRRAFESAVRVRGFVDYRGAFHWARNVDDAIGAIEGLLDLGQAGAVIELCESALRSLQRAIEHVDDSDGHFSMLSGRLQDLHFRACKEARPEPAALAKRLFEAELSSGFDVFDQAVERYAEVLGPEGLAAYRREAEREWALVPARTSEREQSERSRYFRITRIMESLARASGDVEELVSVMSRDLSSPYNYLCIAEVWREHGRN
ncbi:MAG: hypothetical protein KGN84_02120, partial [Acidobacteriota bacterium]|nr:hypothetical protein [Acidobacteriota bacterium]